MERREKEQGRKEGRKWGGKWPLAFLALCAGAMLYARVPLRSSVGSVAARPCLGVLRALVAGARGNPFRGNKEGNAMLRAGPDRATHFPKSLPTPPLFLAHSTFVPCISPRDRLGKCLALSGPKHCNPLFIGRVASWAAASATTRLPCQCWRRDTPSKNGKLCKAEPAIGHLRTITLLQ